ncbi:MAG: segregation/condensation protein A [Planctomycetes bacterium]|nr:segregation/condensation protein A [Planctomycetota bacterium]
MTHNPFTVRLERVFQGPLDLLLHLVREQEVEIHEIEIHSVVQGYLEYLKAMKELDIELAGDFLVMAATLMSIKSRSLLPREEIDLQKELDPRDELIQRLIEYRRFKEASDHLGERYALREQSYERGDAGAEAPTEEPVLELGELTSWDLLAAFSRLMRETLGNRPHRVQGDTRPLRHYVQTLAARMREAGRLSLRQIVLGLDEAPSRDSLIGSFCALLELVKLGLVGVVQPDRNGEIEIELKQEHESDIESLIESSVFDDEAPVPDPEMSVAAAEPAPSLEAPAEPVEG